MTRRHHAYDPDAVAVWHRHGVVRFGLCFALLIVATIVNGAAGLAPWLALGTTLALAAVVFAVMTLVGWTRHRWSLMFWPITLFAAILALDLVQEQVAGLVMGLVVLSYLFVGLSQPPGRSYWLVPLTTALYLQVQDFDLQTTAIRLPIATAVWILCAEVPARLLSELREKQVALELLATTDALTGLLNRSSLETAVERAGANGAVAMIDLDHFKAFNDEHGHLAGDVALIDFAKVLRHGLRPNDKVFRYGGEEFVIVLNNISLSDAARVVERIRTAWAIHSSALTFSAGVTSSATPASIRRADALLYQAKAQGRNRVVVDVSGDQREERSLRAR